jgi:hypothetical protein
MDTPPPLSDTEGEMLAWHLSNCPDCSNRWEHIQSDAHVDLAELYALTRLDDDHFAKLRANNHTGRYQRCQPSVRALNSFVLAADPGSVHYGNLITTLRKEPEQEVMRRSGKPKSLRAVVLHSDGQPAIHRNSVERAELIVHNALLAKDGRLTVELQATRSYTQAQILISVSGSSVMFPPEYLQQKKAQFLVETHMVGERRQLPLSHLAAWVIQ